MKEIRIGNTVEQCVERADYPPEKIKAILGGETVAVLGYGVQGRGQSLNMRDNGVKVIVGVLVTDGVRVAVKVRVTVNVRVMVGVKEGVGVSVTVGDLVMVGVSVFVGVDGMLVGVSVPTITGEKRTASAPNSSPAAAEGTSCVRLPSCTYSWLTPSK